MQYTLRGIPKRLDAALRRRAKREKKTLNETAIQVMEEGLGLGASGAARYRSVRDLVGALAMDAELDRALEDQRQIDPGLWR